MINFKSIGMGIGLSSIAVMMMSNPVNEMINNNRPYSFSYSTEQSNNIYPEDEIDDTLVKEDDDLGFDERTVEACKVYDEDIDVYYNEDNLLRKVAHQYSQWGYEIYDVNSLSDYLEFGLKDSSDELYERGIYAVDDFFDPDVFKFIVACDEEEYEEFKESCGYSWKNSGNGYTYRYDDNTFIRVQYDDENGVMIYTQRHIYG